MLAFLRRKQKGLKWVLWIVIVALAAGMVLLFVSTPGNVSQGLSGQDVAEVSGRPISAVEFRRQYARLYETYRQVYKLDQQDPEIIKRLGLGQQALNQLISEYALTSEARKLGIDASKDEIRQEITKLPVFQERGQFIGTARYEQILKQNNLSVGEFEESVRRDIIREKVMHLLTDGIITTPEEAQREYVERNQEAKVRYVAIDREAGQVSADEQELRKHYESNKESYRTGEQRRVDYVFVRADPAAAKVSEEQIQARLNSVNPEEQVRARHILIKSIEGKDDTEARKKAEAILARVKAGEDFAKLAKEVSDDPASAAEGGDLGFFGRGQMVPEFERVAFALEPGKTSDLVRSPFGFHIINVIEKTTTKPESQKPLVEFELRQAEANRQARDQAYKAVHDLKSSKSMADVAKTYKLDVTTSPYFGVSDSIAGMMVRNDFNQRVFTMKKGDVSQPYQGAGGYYVAQLTEVKAPEIPPFETVRQRVEADYKSTKAEQMAREKAFALQNQAKSGDLEAAGRKAGLKVTTTNFFKKGANVDDTLRFSQEFHDRVFAMEKGEVGLPIQVSGKYVIFQVVDKSQVDLAKFEQEKEQLQKEITDQKRTQFFGAFIRNLVEDLRKKNEIIVNQQLLDDMTS